MLENLKFKIVLGVLILSALGNAYLIWGKGVHIDRSSNSDSISTSTSYSNSSSSSIAVNINGGTYWGTKKAFYSYKEFKSIDEAITFINGQSEGNLYNWNPITINNTIYVVYRSTDNENEHSMSIITEKKVKDGVVLLNTTKKIVDGKENK